MKKFILMFVCMLILPFIGGCDDAGQQGTAPQPQSSQEPLTEKEVHKMNKEADTVREDALDQWLGKWDGPEGTYMKIERSGDGYGITIKNLDKEERYLGVRDFMHLRFHRGDKEETITLGSGRDSGMKWLAGKPFCLIVNKGEADCRDKLEE